MIWISLVLALGLGAITVVFWKQGAVTEAEKPESKPELTVPDARERKAFLKRCVRWREEGKLSREEFERILSLCETDW